MLTPHEPGHNGATPTSISLLENAISGDQEAWAKVVFIYSPLVDKWCRSRLQNAEAVREIGQDVFVQLFRSLRSFRKDEAGHSFRKWLFKITQNKIKDHWKKVGQEPRPVGGSTAQDLMVNLSDGTYESESEEEEEWSKECEQRILLRRCLELVKREIPRAYAAFEQVVIEGKEPREVALALGMERVGAVYTAKSRVLDRLRKMLNQFGEELPSLKLPSSGSLDS